MNVEVNNKKAENYLVGYQKKIRVLGPYSHYAAGLKLVVQDTLG